MTTKHVDTILGAYIATPKTPHLSRPENKNKTDIGIVIIFEKQS